MPPLPREIESKLVTYRALLEKWQAKINLVSADTLADADRRHFQDSLQLLKFLKPTDKVVVDLGSGAGFPGLVLAIARPDLQVHLVESDEKKCTFMEHVSRETKTIVYIHNARLEGKKRTRAGEQGQNKRTAETPSHSLPLPLGERVGVRGTQGGGLPEKVDVLTARALAPLADLLGYAAPFAAENPDIRLIFLKGRTWRDEIAASRAAGWGFEIEDTPSKTAIEGKILTVTKLKISDENS